MSFVAAATVAVGAGVSALGTAKNASASRKASKANAKAQGELYDRQALSLNNLIGEKKDKLYNLGNIFDRFESTGAFGDTDTLKNLRKAQSDYAALAAGDFTGFESQLRKGMSDALINTVGSGSPIGAYAGLAADQQMQFRKDGIETAMSISDYLSRESQSLLGSEFGIMDQRFNTMYELDKNKVGGTNASRSEAAATAGVGTQAIGSALQQAGGSLYSQGRLNQQYDMEKMRYDSALNTAKGMNTPRKALPYTPPSYYSGRSMGSSYNEPSSSGGSLANYPAGTPAYIPEDTYLGVLPPLPSNPNPYYTASRTASSGSFMDQYNSRPAGI
jgi:hypothetical protein